VIKIKGVITMFNTHELYMIYQQDETRKQKQTKKNRNQ